MNEAGLKAAVVEFLELKKELIPAAEGVGLRGLKITVYCKTPDRAGADRAWDFVDVSMAGGCLRGVGRHDKEGLEAPGWFRVYLAPEEVLAVEFEYFGEPEEDETEEPPG